MASVWCPECNVTVPVDKDGDAICPTCLNVLLEGGQPPAEPIIEPEAQEFEPGSWQAAKAAAEASIERRQAESPQPTVSSSSQPATKGWVKRHPWATGSLALLALILITGWIAGDDDPGADYYVHVLNHANENVLVTITVISPNGGGVVHEEKCVFELEANPYPDDDGGTLQRQRDGFRLDQGVCDTGMNYKSPDSQITLTATYADSGREDGVIGFSTGVFSEESYQQHFVRDWIGKPIRGSQVAIHNDHVSHDPVPFKRAESVEGNQ